MFYSLPLLPKFVLGILWVCLGPKHERLKISPCLLCHFYFLQSGNLMTASNTNYREHWQEISCQRAPPIFMTSFEKLHCCCSVAQSSDSLRPHGQEHTRLSYPSPSPKACSNSCPSSPWCHPAFPYSVIPFNLFLPLIFPSNKFFSNELALRIRWPQYWSFSFSISPYNEYSGLISFRIDWFDLLAVHGTL